MNRRDRLLKALPLPALGCALFSLSACDDKSAVMLKRLNDVNSAMEATGKRLEALETAGSEMRARMEQASGATARVTDEALKESLIQLAGARAKELQGLLSGSGSAVQVSGEPGVVAPGHYCGEVTLTLRDGSGREVAVPLTFLADAAGVWSGPSAATLMSRLAATGGSAPPAPKPPAPVTDGPPKPPAAVITNPPRRSGSPIPGNLVKSIDMTTKAPLAPAAAPEGGPSPPPVAPPPPEMTAPSAPRSNPRPPPLPPGARIKESVDLRK